MRYSTLQRIQRFLSLIVIITIMAIVYIIVRTSGYEMPGDRLWQLINTETPIPPKQIALIIGHAGFDSGAICTDADNNVTLTEVAVNARITQLIARNLSTDPTLVNVTILDEKDERLTGLQADVMLSLHSDSCIDLSGFKAVSDPNSELIDAHKKLLTCINNRYAAATQLPYHATTVTRDMLDYYAFGRIDPQTPAAILEMGFLGGDQQLLVAEPERVAQGVVDSVNCFLNNELWPEENQPD